MKYAYAAMALVAFLALGCSGSGGDTLFAALSDWVNVQVESGRMTSEEGVNFLKTLTEFRADMKGYSLGDFGSDLMQILIPIAGSILGVNYLRGTPNNRKGTAPKG